MNKIMVVITVVVAVPLLLVTSCSSFESTQQPPLEPATSPAATPSPKPASQPVPTPPQTPIVEEEDTENYLDVLIKGILKEYPNNMMGHNGNILVMAFVRNHTTGYWSLFLNVSNYSSSTIHTNPLYFTILDNNETAYQYSSNSYSLWGEATFRGINLPPGANTGVKFLDFVIPPPAEPKELIYSDGSTPLIRIDWKN